jgi:hypothetical protein
MMWLIAWIESGHAITVIIFVVLAEMALLALWKRRRGVRTIIGLIPGLCLMLALRAALIGQGSEWIGLWLTAALPAHLLDLKLRLKAEEVPQDLPHP